MNPEQINLRFERHTRTSRFFPTPADILDANSEVDAAALKLKAEREWQRSLEWVARYYHPDLGISAGVGRVAPELDALNMHAIKAAGGFRRLWECSEADLVWCRKAFLEYYLNAQETGKDAYLLTDAEAKRFITELAQRSNQVEARPSAKHTPEQIEEQKEILRKKGLL